MSYSSRLVNATAMLVHAKEHKYAIAHININNLEWAKTVLLTAQELKSPLIIGVSVGAIKYIGGYKTVVQMVDGLLHDLDITVPVALHLDHGSYEACKLAIAAGFSSVMFDGSHLSFSENYTKSQEIIDLATAKNISVEVEVGAIGGEEDGIVGNGEIADINECVAISKLNISMLAAGIGNIHGIYPENWKGLNFAVLAEIAQKTNRPIVLHGGSGIPEAQIKQAIALGVAKINVNTELQLAFAAATEQYCANGHAHDLKKKGFDPRKLLKPGCEAMRQVIIEKMKLFGSNDRV